MALRNSRKFRPTFIFTLPTVVAYEQGSVDEWRKVFYIAIAILVAGGLIYVIFAKGEVLPWAKDDTNVLSMTPLPEADDKESANLDQATVLVSGNQDGQCDRSEERRVGKECR